MGALPQSITRNQVNVRSGKFCPREAQRELAGEQYLPLRQINAASSEEGLDIARLYRRLVRKKNDTITPPLQQVSCPWCQLVAVDEASVPIEQNGSSFADLWVGVRERS